MLKSLFKYSISLVLLWLFVFFVNRLFFVLYQLPIGNKIKSNTEITKAFYMGYKIDIATAVILFLLPFLLAALYLFFQKSFFKKTCYVLFILVLVIYTITSIADAGLYREWNAKLNMQALAHFANPDEVFKTVSLQLVALFFLLIVLFSFPFYFFYKKKIHPILLVKEEKNTKAENSSLVFFFLIIVGVSIITIRGGVRGIPMNQSEAYFSKDVMANDIAVNPLYSLLQDMTIKSNIPDEAIYKVRSNEEAQQIIASDFVSNLDSTISILNTDRPNLVYIFLESWSADNVGILGGVKDCTPQFDKLCNEGLLFTNAYSQAYVSDQGIPAILSGYPSVSRIAIINQPAKVHGLPCISQDLSKYNYTSSFMFGGDLVYGNLRGYLLEKGFTNLVEQKDFSHYPSGSLGVHDEYTFPELLKILNQKKQPFLQGFFTTSTQMPYDFQSTDHWTSSANDAEKKYTEATHYTDLHLGNMMEQAKKETWYNNTLFIIVADHSHNSIKQWDATSAQRQHIPLLLVGGALQPQWRGAQWNKIVSQLDINATILTQMNIKSTQYPWSRNVLNSTTPSSAYYIFFGGVGYVNDNGYCASNQLNFETIIQNVKDTTQAKSMFDKATSFQQLIYEDVKNR